MKNYPEDEYYPKDYKSDPDWFYNVEVPVTPWKIREIWGGVKTGWTGPEMSLI